LFIVDHRSIELPSVRGLRPGFFYRRAIAMPAPSARVTLVKILHPDLPGGVFRLQSFQTGDYSWQGEVYRYQSFDLEGGGAVFRGCDVGSSGLRLIIPLSNLRDNPKLALTEFIVGRALLGAVCQIVQIFPGSQLLPELARIPMDAAIVKDGLIIWDLRSPSTATGRSILGVHPNRQFIEY
jgi:hypothetical protein